DQPVNAVGRVDSDNARDRSAHRAGDVDDHESAEVAAHEERGVAVDQEADDEVVDGQKLEHRPGRLPLAAERQWDERWGYSGQATEGGEGNEGVQFHA